MLQNLCRILTTTLAAAGLTAVFPTVFPAAGANGIANAATCEAIIFLGQGDRLTYRLWGSLSEKTPEMPQTLSRATLAMTVQRRNRNGTVQTLLDATSLHRYEQIAPDADYAKLLFTGVFRGQPNDGKRIYTVPESLHGLYASLRPSWGEPQQVQIIHYLGAGQFVRSAAGTCRPI